MTTPRRIRLCICSDLSIESLQEAAALFLSERIEGKLADPPPTLQLYVHQYAMPQARELVASLIKPYPAFDVLPSPNLTLEEHDWYIGAEGYPFVVDGYWPVDWP